MITISNDVIVVLLINSARHFLYTIGSKTLTNDEFHAIYYEFYISRYAAHYWKDAGVNPEGEIPGFPRAWNRFVGRSLGYGYMPISGLIHRLDRYSGVVFKTDRSSGRRKIALRHEEVTAFMLEYI